MNRQKSKALEMLEKELRAGNYSSPYLYHAVNVLNHSPMEEGEVLANIVISLCKALDITNKSLFDASMLSTAPVFKVGTK